MDLIVSKLSLKNDKSNTVALGDWCIPSYTYKKAFRENLILIDHPWKEVNNLIRDSKEIDYLYDEILNNLVDRLNNLHDKRFSLRSWEILIGNWLRALITIVYEKEMLINLAIKTKKVNLIKLSFSDVNTYSYSTKEFVKDIQKHEWNEKLINNLVKFDLIDIKTKNEVPKNKIKNKDLNKKNINFIIKNYFKNLYFKITTFLIRNDSYILHGLGFNFFDTVKFKMKAGFMPHFQFPYPQKRNIKKNNYMRNKLSFKNKNNNKLKNILTSKLIPEYLPVLFVEDFSRACEFIKNNYPKSPKSIITSNAYFSDDFFKLFISTNVDKGCRYSVIQHGGAFGTHLIYDEEKLIINTCDNFYTWGWKSKKYKNKLNNFLPRPSLKLSLIKPINNSNPDYLLFPTSEWPLYNYRIYNSAHSYGQFKEFEFIYKLYNSLPNSIAQKFRLSLDKNTRSNEWEATSRFISNNMGNCILDNSEPFTTQMNRAKLVVINTNSTTILEALVLNVPTIWILDPEVRPTNSEFKDEFLALYKVGILFYDYKKAIKQIITKFNNPNIWWNSRELQKSRERFISRFAMIDHDITKNFKKTFN